MKDIHPEVGKVLKECGIAASDGAWKHPQSGKWIVTHKACEQIAAFKGIKYDEPKFLVAEPKAAALVVTGHLGDMSEWSVGEAVIDLNYNVKGKQPGYPFAMAEKRAKDRVILKLVSLHGVAYSEDESDDFKRHEEPKQKEQEAQPHPPRTPEQLEYLRVKDLLESANNMQEAHDTWMANVDDLSKLPEDWQNRLMNIRDRFNV